MRIRDYDLSQHRSLTLAVLSDTHSELNPHIAEVVRSCDAALHAGDIMGAAPLNALKPRLGMVIAVRGNNDFPYSWPPEEHTILADIPAAARIQLAGGEIVMEHSDRVYSNDFSQIHARLRQSYPNAKLVVYGHTHVRHVDQTSTPWLANPGAAGRVRVHEGPSCLTLHIDGNDWRIEEHVFPA